MFVGAGSRRTIRSEAGSREPRLRAGKRRGEELSSWLLLKMCVLCRCCCLVDVMCPSTSLPKPYRVCSINKVAPARPAPCNVQAFQRLLNPSRRLFPSLSMKRAECPVANVSVENHRDMQRGAEGGAPHKKLTCEENIKIKNRQFFLSFPSVPSQKVLQTSIFLLSVSVQRPLQQLQKK